MTQNIAYKRIIVILNNTLGNYPTNQDYGPGFRSVVALCLTHIWLIFQLQGVKKTYFPSFGSGYGLFQSSRYVYIGTSTKDAVSVNTVA